MTHIHIHLPAKTVDWKSKDAYLGNLSDPKEAGKLDLEIKKVRAALAKADSQTYPALNSKLVELLKKRNHFMDSTARDADYSNLSDEAVIRKMILGDKDAKAEAKRRGIDKNTKVGDSK